MILTNNRNVILYVFLVILVIALLYSNSKISSILKNVDNLSTEESDKREYQLYLLFLGLVIPFLEILFELFHVRPKSLLINNFSIGCFFLLLFLISEKSKYLYNRIKTIYIFLFYVYSLLVGYNIIFLQQDIIPTYAFIVLFFFSYIIIKPIKKYWIFSGFVFCYLILLYAFDLVPVKRAVILINYGIMVFIINHIRHVSLTKIQEKFNFTNEIVNKGNSLTIATNKEGKVTFCSDTITSILGYTPNEVMGFGFWKLTEDPEFIGSEYHENFVDNRLYIRKLKCKNGEYKFIQWIDKKFAEDSIIGIGQDVTNEIKIRKQYETLIQTAVDIIFEANYRGDITFVNDYAIKLLGYTKEEFISKNFSSLIRKDYITNTMSFYQNILDIEDNFTTLEFPILKKNGEEVWISQNVFIRRNSFGEIDGYSGIARDITLLKDIEDEKSKRQDKIEKYSKTLKDIAILNHSKNENFDQTINTILKITASTLGVNRAGYWTYQEDGISCSNLYDSTAKIFENDIYFYKIENAGYFKKIENKNQVVLSNIRSHSTNNKKNDSYIYKHNIFSILDTPVFIDGKLKGILSFEATQQIKNWDNEDINFAKSISDLIVIAIASQMRLEIEQRLAYKSELLLVINKNTNQFLLQKSTSKLIKGIINELGIVTQSERISYFKKDPKTQLFDQKCMWTNQLQDFDTISPKLQNIEFSKFDNNIKDLPAKQFFEYIKDNILTERIKIFLSRLNPDSILFFPVFIKNEFDGFFVFDDSTKERIWSTDEISILQLLVKNISSSIERNINESIIEESEERFRLLANNIPGTVFLSNYDEKYTKIYLNDEIEKLTGYPKSDFLENKIFFIDLIFREDLENVLMANKIALEEKKPLHIIYRIKHKNDSLVWVEEFGDSIIKNGEIAFMEGIIIDITEKKNNESIVKEKEFAEAANKAKSEFLANMSHEIRTPLNGIIGYTDLLMNSNLESTQKQYMNTINQSANILLEVVNDILDFSKIESGKLEINIEKYRTEDIILQIKELINYQAHSKNLEINYYINEDVPKYIWVDYIRLKQVLINLLTNAVKFTHVGNIDLTISVLEIQKSQTTLRFSVKDTGIGIRKSNQKIIFQAFSQEDSSTTKKFGGTGLGLTISNQLLGLMNSKLQITSQYNIGSTFFFDIKLKSSNKSKQGKTIDNQSFIFENSIVEFENEEPSILIVEDNKINMLLTKTLVKQIIPKCIIHEAIDGEKAIEKALEIQPNIILMDIQMPLINGYEATKLIRKNKEFKDIIIIALTAGTVMGEKEKCIEAGMNDYVPKPIVKKTLEDILEKWLITKSNFI
ncbi:PAS domain S-box protein [Flavobacterium taihuense]|uniref:histidine kinase n=1 Tax=Flavobacterium taihuense TaxID=2857508 RepID=A0ABS6XWC0_9FLAO|nr:PAS domain S-box protein [Flavobacterium taihuense]MBW4360975.1 PAS domain S-box protein [Flavobacterium taihuense]